MWRLLLRPDQTAQGRGGGMRTQTYPAGVLARRSSCHPIPSPRHISKRPPAAHSHTHGRAVTSYPIGNAAPICTGATCAYMPAP